MKKKSKLIISLLLFCLLVLIGYFVFQKFNNQAIVAPEIKADKIVIPARPSTFLEGQRVFINTVKLARVASLKNNEADIKNYAEQAFILWRDIVNEFINTPPEDLLDSENWMTDLSSVYTAIQEADQLSKEVKFDLVAEKLDESRILLNKINLNQQDAQDNNRLFSLLLVVKKIDQATSLDEADSYLDELKLVYTDAKNISNDNEFKTLCQDFETILSEIDNATIATFPRAQIKLMPVFVELYEKY